VGITERSSIQRVTEWRPCVLFGVVALLLLTVSFAPFDTPAELTGISLSKDTTQSIASPAPKPNMYSTTIKQLAGGVKRVIVSWVGRNEPVEFAEAMHLLRSGDAELIQLITSALREPDGISYFWEHPPVTSASARRPYEFVVAPAPALQGVQADDGPFQEHLSGCEPASSCVFYNLGGDSMLIAPSAAAGLTNLDAYTHMANFVREAPSAQVGSFLQTVGSSMIERLEQVGDSTPVYLSTSGLGVYWLHVRLDSRPKYYTFRQYKQAEPNSEQMVSV